ncbi:hypothetical protein CBL_03144 [Carabus blaptoides fortunei]
MIFLFSNKYNGGKVKNKNFKESLAVWFLPATQRKVVGLTQVSEIKLQEIGNMIRNAFVQVSKYKTVVSSVNRSATMLYGKQNERAVKRNPEANTACFRSNGNC